MKQLCTWLNMNAVNPNTIAVLPVKNSRLCSVTSRFDGFRTGEFEGGIYRGDETQSVRLFSKDGKNADITVDAPGGVSRKDDGAPFSTETPIFTTNHFRVRLEMIFRKHDKAI